MSFDITSKLSIGSWLQLADPALTEMMVGAGFDWLTIDLEHTSTTMSETANLIRVGDLAGVPMFVRLSGHDPAQIKRVLDAGASGIIAPMVNSAEQAKRIVAAAYYPPRGDRGVGLARAQGYGQSFDHYRDHQADNVDVIVQIEHVDGVRDLGSILSVEGVAGFFVGPYDLSGSLGHPGDFTQPAVAAAMAEVERYISPGGPVAGIHVVEPDVDQLEEAIERGYRFIALASEMLIFSGRMAELAAGLASVDR
ncbi:MAG: HpcH/HpaI aldolase family protein [Acidimicrobiia bacterium]